MEEGPKKNKVLLETDFPVVEIKPKIPFKKSSLPSEQIKMDWLQDKGNNNKPQENPPKNLSMDQKPHNGMTNQ